MKLNEKQLTLIFCILFAVLIIGYYILSRPSQELAPLTDIKPSGGVLPLSAQEQARVDQMLLEKPTSLSKEDESAVEKIAETPIKPLSEVDEARLKQMLSE